VRGPAVYNKSDGSLLAYGCDDLLAGLLAQTPRGPEELIKQYPEALDNAPYNPLKDLGAQVLDAVTDYLAAPKAASSANRRTEGAQNSVLSAVTLRQYQNIAFGGHGKCWQLHRPNIAAGQLAATGSSATEAAHAVLSRASIFWSATSAQCEPLWQHRVPWHTKKSATEALATFDPPGELPVNKKGIGPEEGARTVSAWLDIIAITLRDQAASAIVQLEQLMGYFPHERTGYKVYEKHRPSGLAYVEPNLHAPGEPGESRHRITVCKIGLHDPVPRMIRKRVVYALDPETTPEMRTARFYTGGNRAELKGLDRNSSATQSPLVLMPQSIARAAGADVVSAVLFVTAANEVWSEAQTAKQLRQDHIGMDWFEAQGFTIVSSLAGERNPLVLSGLLAAKREEYADLCNGPGLIVKRCMENKKFDLDAEFDWTVAPDMWSGDQCAALSWPPIITVVRRCWPIAAEAAEWSGCLLNRVAKTRCWQRALLPVINPATLMAYVRADADVAGLLTATTFQWSIVCDEAQVGYSSVCNYLYDIGRFDKK